jgi:hypothetical protein
MLCLKLQEAYEINRMERKKLKQRQQQGGGLAFEVDFSDDVSVSSVASAAVDRKRQGSESSNPSQSNSASRQTSDSDESGKSKQRKGWGPPTNPADLRRPKKVTNSEESKAGNAEGLHNRPFTFVCH